MTRALLMSSSKKDNLGYLEHAGDQLATFLDGAGGKALLIPYAAVSVSYDSYEQLAAPAFREQGVELVSIHHFDDPVQAVREASVIAVAGGNSFALLTRLYEAGLVELVRDRVLGDEASYVGWSAGSNVATPTIRTTNDMPIVEPPSFDGFGIVPFQMNPHFISGKPQGHNGESREDRLNEFTAFNPDEEVLALYEGCALFVTGEEGTILGGREGLVFRHGHDARTIEAGTPFRLNEIRGAVR